MNLYEDYKVVQAFEPKTTNAAISSNYLTLKDAITATVIVNLAQGVGNATQVSLYQAKDVSGTGAKPLLNNVPIWVNEDTGTSDALVRESDGVSYTVANTAKNKQIIFHVDPPKLDLNNGYPCLGVKIGASSQATNFAFGEFILEMKYGQADPPSVLVD